MTDKELIRKVHSGNKDALNSIIEKYYDEIYRFCLYLTGWEADSYDITQEVFLKFIRYVDSYQYKNLKGYLLTIARNLCYDHFRHKKEESCLEKAQGQGEEDPHLAFAEDGLLLRDALFKIPEEQREVIILRIYEEFKFTQIAGMLGCSLSTAKSRYRLGIRKLREIMEEERYGY
ncbi:MAG: RNA polymerase sigma factor [Ruminococcus sp.]|nr:RNA polymerase sigma factor [Ruminococcus sp.]